MPPDATAYDAWALHAVTLSAGDGAAPLERIVATGDYINHAVFTPEELQASLGRLLAGGLIEERKRGYAPAQVVRHRLAVGGIVAQRAEARQIVRQARIAALPPSQAAPDVPACEAAIAAYYGGTRGA